ncbi:Biofilm growth-associated repressor [Shinella zoogloeoides]|nr:Biofilm growth-associated repressor [Shinella zoogloeoides]
MVIIPFREAMPASRARAIRAARVASLLKSLAHPARLMLVCTLCEKEASVSELEEELCVHQPTLSQQLNVLREAGLVESRREGKQIFYRLTDERAVQLMGALGAIFPSEPKPPF